MSATNNGTKPDPDRRLHESYPETGIWEIWALERIPNSGQIVADPHNPAAFMGRRYVFVTVQFSANKCAIELYEKPEKGEKMTCLSVLWKSDHLFSSQWIWGERRFF